jgi:hypothetical protein
VPDPMSFTVSALALLVSVIALVASWRSGNRQNDLQERLVTLETNREQDRQRQTRSAELRATIEHGTRDMRETRVLGKPPQYWLTVRNEGMTGARQVRVLLDGAPALQHVLVPRGEDDISTLGPGTEFRYVLAVTLGGPRVLHARIEWADDSDDARSWESQLKV